MIAVASGMALYVKKVNTYQRVFVDEALMREIIKRIIVSGRSYKWQDIIKKAVLIATNATSIYQVGFYESIFAIRWKDFILHSKEYQKYVKRNEYILERRTAVEKENRRKEAFKESCKIEYLNAIARRNGVRYHSKLR